MKSKSKPKKNKKTNKEQNLISVFLSTPPNTLPFQSPHRTYKRPHKLWQAIESKPSPKSEELEEIKAGEEVEDYEILENIISNVRKFFVEEGVEEEQPSL